MDEQDRPQPVPLSPAQRKHLAELLAAREQANRSVQQFVAYLYAEHSISVDEYPTIDALIGFVPKAP